MANLVCGFAHVDLRKGFHGIAVPVQIKGLGGSGAPHVFTLQRREDLELGPGEEIVNTLWGYNPHPHDVILRTMGLKPISCHVQVTVELRN